MVLTREDFAELSLSELLYNIWLYAEFVIKGNCKPFFNENFQNFNFVIQMLLHRKHFDFSNICTDNMDSIIDMLKK